MAAFMECEKDPGWQYLKLSADRIREEQSAPYNSKTACWVPDKEEGYLAAEIKSTKGDQVSVVTAKGNELTLKKDLVQEMNPPKFTKCEDMSNLSFLNDASVLWNLRDRYAAMLIYTYSGLFCVVINPYKRLPIYTESVARMFMGKRKNEMPPHLNAVSDNAYRNMLQDRENQSMLITGESGAGKTENTKKVISYFASVGAKQAEEMGIKAETGEGGKKKATLEEQIVQTNPVLEAFGNAKTVRNNNSSRFGKFIRIHFSKDGRVAGCDIEHYLLEKSRVIRQAPGERCYHIFYQMMSGWNKDLKKQLLLDRDPGGYWFINQAELTINGIDDVEEHGLTDEAFDILNFDETEKLECYKLMSWLLHMGEMKFKQKSSKDDQAEPDEEEEAGKCGQMMGLGEKFEDFVNALCKPRVKVGTEWVNKAQNVQQVNWARGAMAKGTYNRVFDWLVAKCNKTLDAKAIPREYFIGVLDIAGFEIFDFNSFEQLWINFVNEKLQQFFNHHMFVLEQEEYQREGIHWEFIDFGLDLAACIELIEKPLGVISMLDEECIVPKATDLTLAGKLQDTYQGKHPSFEKPKPPKGKQADAHFALKHYAGLVRYNVLNWLEKNKDPLNDTVISVMKKQTGNALLKLLWQDFQTMEEQAEAAKSGGGGGKKRGKSASMMTVSMMYRESLNNLMSMLNSTHPHFIRCLIPNEQKKSGMIEADLVLNQLTCNGVLEGIRICRKGFPNRLQHPEFKIRYAILAADAAKTESDDLKDIADAMMAKIVADGDLTNEDFRVGFTKVFFKAGILAKLEDLRDDKLGTIFRNMQARIRFWTANTDAAKRAEQMSGFTILQNNIRAWTVLRTWEWYKVWGMVKPHLKSGKLAEEMKRMTEQLKVVEEKLGKAEGERKTLEGTLGELTAANDEIKNQLSGSASDLDAEREQMTKLDRLKREQDAQMADLEHRLSDIEKKGGEMASIKRKAEQDCNDMKSQLKDLEAALTKLEGENQEKNQQLLKLADKTKSQDDSLNNSTRDKAHNNAQNQKLLGKLQDTEDKANRLRKETSRLKRSVDEASSSLSREMRSLEDTDDAKRHVKEALQEAQKSIDDLTGQKYDMENDLKKKDQEYQAAASRLQQEQNHSSKLERQMREVHATLNYRGETFFSEYLLYRSKYL